jgi:RNA polymerase sigma-70 factor (ECF subfamily)
VNSASQQLHHILQGCQQEHRASQKALYDLFYAFSMGICMRYAHNEEDAVEVVQDGFLKIFRHLGDFTSPKDSASLFPAFRGWVKKIMVYTAIDHYRFKKKHPEADDLDNQYYRLPAGGQQPLDKLSYDELVRTVQTLSPAYRAVFNLFVIDGYSHEEIAQTLGISVGTSKSNLAKARENLRQKLKQLHETFDAKYE